MLFEWNAQPYQEVTEESLLTQDLSESHNINNYFLLSRVQDGSIDINRKDIQFSVLAQPEAHNISGAFLIANCDTIINATEEEHESYSIPPIALYIPAVTDAQERYQYNLSVPSRSKIHSFDGLACDINVLDLHTYEFITVGKGKVVI